ncbi:hypothetical protein [Streptomyces sp. NBC_00503]|uniref:hypothetical protein n=1 Tax=Streptomyces sp. NBC_00503 TaxID=2903659 RepID=UPI002E80E280|nr:hypothetical protein [Streptomyces sp. NBC_00503]WUD84960.1 hypothetical protein OG490_32850 [Streptomyces sp. NBC_00503]
MAAVAAVAVLGGCSSGGAATDRAAASPSGSPTPSAPNSPAAPSAAPSASASSQAPSSGQSPQSDRSWPDVFTVINKWKDQPRGVGAPDAEAVHSKSVGLLNDTETRYGSEKGSKCWPERPTSLTALCAGNAAKAAETAKTSLSWISHEDPRTFTTLRANAGKVTKAVESYKAHACESAPAARAERDACWEAGWTIAQAYPLLRDGFNAALQAR